MSYRCLGDVPAMPAVCAPTALPPDVSRTPIEEFRRRRGWLAIPTNDVRDYVTSQLTVAAAGFAVGIAIGATLGDIRGRLAKK